MSLNDEITRLILTNPKLNAFDAAQVAYLKLETLIQDVHDDLLQRAEVDSTVDLSSTLWRRVKDVTS